MNRNLLLTITLGVGLSTAAAEDKTANPQYVTPVIEGHGKIVRLPDAAVQPEQDSKVVIDVVSDKKEGDNIKALDRAALIFNQYADAGAPIKMAVVLHGPATKSALSDAAFKEHENADKNPDLELIKALKNQGVEVFVCGQALAHHKFALDEVAPDVTVAASAATVNIQRQKDGYSYLPFH